ncbi:hypothetical protein BKH46_02705 [Helicobacter sp. 12S02634-8]|uniref:glycosyltransferase n=1 Tax=Helicobacter sp. 12S02634-8 TaxID=1476199 RepID=UPI000BA5745F|nr:glycosyltransferase [Helicobacter sp. 12S02634-8]PAF47766.1 hypothetical protein BKH46_02705 [Helicobacter sp. 12S02634-8]
MLKILILCAANPATNPRPQRLITLLKDTHKLTALGINASAIRGVEVFSYPAFHKRNIFEEIRLYKNVFSQNWQQLIYTPNRLQIAQILTQHSFDLIICCDLVLLPIALAYKKGAKILFDAREFYPAQNKSNLRWRLLFARFNDYLCKTYLPLADRIITVSKGLQTMYQTQYGISCELFYSLPKYHNITPSHPKADKIKIIYHGGANPSRKIEHCIELAAYLQDRFELDLMLVHTDKNYQRFLEKSIAQMRSQGKKINLLPPVPFEEIIPFTAAYDLGLYMIPPSNANLKHALPNKFFEYIQARLGLIIAPNPEMIPFVQSYQNGYIAKDFDPKTIAKAINALSYEEIISYKQRSHIAAKTLNMQTNKNNINALIKALFP